MTDDEKQALIDKYRHINVDHDWWDFVECDFHEICKRMGIDLDWREPSFSGFCSQGDGASFTGTFTGTAAEEAPKNIREHAPVDEELHRIADELCLIGRVYYSAYAHIGRHGGSNYVHECTMHVEYLEPCYGEEEDWADEVHDAVERGVQDLMRDLARWYYQALEQEYDHLTSDEVVWDTIEANELDVMASV